MKEDLVKDIRIAADKIANTQYHLDKFGIFKYDTLDEADPKKERIRTDLTVEIGGPSTHINITVLSRREHTIIKQAMADILQTRLADATEQLRDACLKYGRE